MQEVKIKWGNSRESQDLTQSEKSKCYAEIQKAWYEDPSLRGNQVEFSDVSTTKMNGQLVKVVRFNNLDEEVPFEIKLRGDKMQNKIEFQEKQQRVILHNIDIDLEGIINFDILGLELIEIDGDTAFLDILPGNWHVHKVDGLGEYEYGIGIECIHDRNQWIDKFYDDRPMK